MLLAVFAIVYFMHDLIVKESTYFTGFVIITLSSICIAVAAHFVKTGEIVDDMQKERKRKRELSYYGEDCKFIH